MPADNMRVEGDIVEQAVWRPFMVIGAEGEEITMWAWACEAPWERQPWGMQEILHKYTWFLAKALGGTGCSGPM